LFLNDTLHSVPCFSNDLLSQYDSAIYDCLLKLLNINFNANALAWQQATLPASFGGLGIRLVSDLALPAFLSAFVGTDSLVKQLLPSRVCDVAGTNDAVYCQALDAWLHTLHSTKMPLSVRQRAWDEPLMRLKAEGVLFAALSDSLWLV